MKKVILSNLPSLKEKPLLSVCIPAYNEQENIGRTIDAISIVLNEAFIPFEFVIANDNSKDGTADVVRNKMESGIPIRMINRIPPGGYGRAVRSTLEHAHGDIVVITMADMSDDPRDIVRYYHKINEGFDAVFGSRFRAGSVLKDYPIVKLIANRIGNKFIQLLFRSKFNDLTNAFKAFRMDAIRSIMPFYASHFNLTIEISLALIVRGFKISEIPINWYGRTWGQANFKIATLGRRYFATLMKSYAEWIFIHDDVMTEHTKTLRVITNTESSNETVETNIDETDSSNGGSGVCRLSSGA